MKKSGIIAIIVAVLLIVGGFLVYWFGFHEKDKVAVAATVNGEIIAEDTVTEYIQSYRTYSNYESDSDWATFLVSYGLTAEDLRTDVINYYAQQMLIESTAKDIGATVDEATIEEEITNIRSTYGYTEDEAWTTALESMGYTIDQYKEEMRQSFLKEAVLEVAVPLADPTEEELQELANSYASSYSGKRSSNILFAEADLETAQTVLAQLQQSTDLAKDFAEAAAKYNTDSSAQVGGDVGYDSANSFVSEYTDALNQLAVGQISGLVKSDYGYHIIMCTDEYIVPTDGSAVDLSLMPEEISERFKADVSSYLRTQKQTAYLNDLVENADIVINEMPEGLIYDVDLTLAETTSSSDTGSGVSTGATQAEGASAGTAAGSETTSGSTTGTEASAANASSGSSSSAATSGSSGSSNS